MDSESPSASTPQPAENPAALALPPAPIATGAQHVCFICLLNDTETPDAKWVNPCPCTLEAHEDCMLRWVAETDQSASRSKGGLRCPACNSRIRVDEPFDSFVFLRDRLHRAYSRTSPLILLMLVASGGVAGSGWYGLTASHVFAGPDATGRWLGLQSLSGRRADVPVWRWLPFWKLNAKIWALSLIGPGLTICRALPPLGNLVMVPASLLSGAVLVAKDDMPTWPPSPTWAMTLFPFVQLTYANVYYEFFGSFEKRLNRALRGRPADDQPRLRDQPAAGQAQDQEDEGLWATIWGLGHAIAGLFGEENEVVLEAEVRMGGPNVELDEGDEEEIEAELAELERQAEVEFNAEDEDRPAGRIVEDIGSVQDAEGEGDEVGAPQPTAQPRVEEGQEDEQQQRHQQEQRQQQERQQQQLAPPREQQAQNQAQNNNQDQAPAGAEDNRTNTTLIDIVNSVVTSLLYPTICFGMGELLRLTLPRHWVTKPTWGRPTGLLQERWGRSLAGGCLYTVLKDAFVLYAKYRRVQVKRNRKVRNVERRR